MLLPLKSFLNLQGCFVYIYLFYCMGKAQCNAPMSLGAGDVDGADSDENSEWLRELIAYNRQQAWYACIDFLMGS